MSRRPYDQKRLHAYHDGELSRLERWWVERRIQRDPAARQELDRLSQLQTTLRGLEADAPCADLWEGLGGRLRGVDAQVEAEGLAHFSARHSWLLRPIAAGALVASAALVLVLSLSNGEAESGGVVRWLDTMGKPVMLLDEADDATIIWVMEGEGDHVSTGETRALV